MLSTHLTATGISYLVPSTDSNEDSDSISQLVIAADVLYYGVLTGVYLNIICSLRGPSDDTVKAESVKGLVLMTASSIIFICTLVVAYFDVFTYIAIQSVDIISDAVCLFLTFAEHESVYKCFCGPFDRCCTRTCICETRSAESRLAQSQTAIQMSTDVQAPTATKEEIQYPE